MAEPHDAADYRPPLRVRVRDFLNRARRWLLRPKVIRQDRIVVVDESDRCENPIFLIGCHRAGTTLVRQIVDSHSHITCPPETFFLLDFEKVAQSRLFFEGLSALGFDRAGAMAGLRHAASYYIEAYRRNKRKPRWAEKTPSYAFILPFLDELFGDKTRYVMIYRFPLDIVDSLRRLEWNFGEHDPDPFMNKCRYVAAVIEKQLAFAAAHPDKCFSLYYERLTHDPQSVLRPLFEFLGEPWEPQVLDFNRQKHDYGLGDHNAQVYKTFKPSMDNWKHWPAEDQRRAFEVLEPWLTRLGYTRDGAASIRERTAT